MTVHFCTYFDHRYLARAIVLHDSLSRHLSDFTLWALCMDDAALRALHALRLRAVKPLPLGEVETKDPDLLRVKPSRTLVEYYFTCSPVLPLVLFERDPSIDRLTYLDADLYFLSPPGPILDEIGESPLAVVPHRYPADRPEDAQWGKFNVGWVTFTRSPTGLAALQWWRKHCLDWCFDRVEGDRFADQKYLDRWPELFPQTHIISNPGANLAPWNVRRHQLTERAGHLQADGTDVVFYHVQGLRQITGRVYRLGLEPYGARANRLLRKHVYAPYLAELVAAQARCNAVLPRTETDTLRNSRRGLKVGLLRSHIRSFVRRDLMHL